MGIELNDMFTGLGDAKQGTNRNYINGIGDYTLEIIKLTTKKSTNPKSLGQNIFAAQFAVVAAEPAPASDDPKGANGEYLYNRPHSVGQVVDTVWNLSKRPMSMKDIKGLIVGIQGQLGEVLTPEETAQLTEFEAGGGDVFAALASLGSAGDGQRFAGLKVGLQVRGTGKEAEGNTAYTRLFFSAPTL